MPKETSKRGHLTKHVEWTFSIVCIYIYLYMCVTVIEIQSNKHVLSPKTTTIQIECENALDLANTSMS